MTLKVKNRIGAGGAFADMFLSDDRAMIYKAFVSPTHQSKGYDAVDQVRRRKVFAAECSAYEIVLRDHRLRVHVPGSFETVVLSDIVDEQGNSVIDNYLKDCCYRMEFIKGADRKIGECRTLYPHIENIEQAFVAAGVRYMTDCSVFFPEDDKACKLIDFAVQEFPPPEYKPPWL